MIKKTIEMVRTEKNITIPKNTWFLAFRPIKDSEIISVLFFSKEEGVSLIH